MPEGDIVFRACRRLDQALAGRVLTVSDFRVPDLATADVTGATVTEVRPIGKHLMVRLSSGLTVHSHLRMEGSWWLRRPDAPLRGGTTDQIRCILANDDWVATGFRLGELHLYRTTEEHQRVGHLGPDLLADDFESAGLADRAVANLAADPERPIGDALLDQRNLAGIGTFYRSELCFLLGVHPLTPVRDVDLGRAVALGRRLMVANLDKAIQVTTGIDSEGRRTWVFERAGRPCRRCRRRILTGRTGEPPRDRISYFCPHCQPAVASRPSR